MPGYAAFAATHRERLVRSLVAETGLPRAAAQAVVRDVLRGAWEHGVTGTDGAAYGWLRVAARHRAAEPGSDWAAAADIALAQARTAAAALAALPPDDRVLLRLRYAEGLLPEALAERLDTTVPDVITRLDRAWAAATSGLVPRRRLGPYARPVAALAVGVAVLVTLLPGGHSRSTVPPQALGTPSYGLGPVETDAVDTAAHSTPLSRATRPADVAVAPDVAVPAGDTATPPRSPGTPCGLAGGCLSHPAAESIRIGVPEQVAELTGHQNFDVPDPGGVCEVTPPPKQVAECVPAES